MEAEIEEMIEERMDERGGGGGGDALRKRGEYGG